MSMSHRLVQCVRRLSTGVSCRTVDTIRLVTTQDQPTAMANGNGNSNGAAQLPLKKPFLIGVAGGTASGKTTVCECIMDAVKKGQINTEQKIVSLSQDSFYKDLTPEENLLAHKGHYNFDHPDAFDHKLFLSCLEDIYEGEPIQIPKYNFKTNSRSRSETVSIQPSDVIFYYENIRNMFDLKLFVDTDADTRLARRVQRDIADRGRELKQILVQYTTHVKPAFEDFCLPTKKFADVIIPRGAENKVAIDLVAQHILDIISKKSQQGSRFSRSRANSEPSH